jgi:hypothetical protein
MSYIGRDLRAGAFRQLDDISSGFDGSTTGFTMQVNSGNVQLGDVNQILLSLGGVIQKPGTDFTISTSTLTFTTAPASGLSFFAILLGSDNGGTVTPTDGSVTSDKLVGNLVTPGTLDVNGQELILDADADTSITADTDDQVDIKIGGNDTIVVKAQGSTPLMQINAGASNNNLYIASTDATSGISLSDNGGSINLATTSSGAFRVMTGGTANTAADDSAISMLIDANGKIATGGETAPDVSAGGITLDQNANDTGILTFKSSDVSHGFTGQVEADTYGRIQKNSSSAGGLQILGLAEDDPGINIFGVADTSSGTVASNTNAIIHIDARKTTGGSVGTIGSDMLCLFSNDGSAKVIITGAGNIHSDASATVGTYDEYEDAHLVRAYDLSHGKGVIDSKFDKFISYNAEKLADLELIGRDDDGTPNSFVNVTGFQKLHNGAIWQQYEKHQRLASAFYKLAEKTIGKEEADKLLTEEEIQLLN